MTDLSFSVVINTINRADLLSDALRGLQALDGPNFEIIVVNGPSTDHTADILDAWAGRIKIGKCEEANLARSRNVGLSLAAGDIVAFIDDDAVPHPQWLSQLAKPYSDPDVGAVGGHTIGRLGSTYQARTTLCDRFGDPYFVSDLADISVFSKPGSWVFPSLLGTNASIRRAALEAVGGFDEVFAYYLEETDLCLRLVDAGWQIRYAPDALVWHQFASSALRSDDMTRRSVGAIVRSHSYFINRHGTRPWSPEAAREAADRLTALGQHWHGGNVATLDEGGINSQHRARLDREVEEALAQGYADAQRNAGIAEGSWTRPDTVPPFLKHADGPRRRLTIAFVCRHYDRPDEAGIPRWTQLLANALADKGHSIHVICQASEPAMRIRFLNGIWKHEIQSDIEEFGWIEERFGLPAEQAQWAASVQNHIATVRSFDLDLLSFPIWELEGIGCVDEAELTLCMSLHTSYGLSLGFRPDWQTRPLLRDQLVNRMIAAENLALTGLPHLLANSSSILDELSTQCGAPLAGRAQIAVHGTPVDELLFDPTRKGNNILLFAGRFERRKGFDIALTACVEAMTRDTRITAIFAGGQLDVAPIDEDLRKKADDLVASGRLQFVGVVSRDSLNDLYCEADIAIVPSRYESFGLVAIEAMAAGCAVLGLSVGAMPEIVTSGVDGVLVSPGEEASAALAEAIRTLLADPKRLTEMQAGASRSARSRFSIAAMADQVETAFRTFIARDRKSANVE